MDFSSGAIDRYWRDRGVALHGVLSRVRSLQDWTVEDEIEPWVVSLGEALESPECAALMLERIQESVHFLSWVSSPVALRIMEALDDHEMGAAARFVYRANEMSENAVYLKFIESLEVLARSHLLAHVFSPDRVGLVEAAITSASPGGGA